MSSVFTNILDFQLPERGGQNSCLQCQGTGWERLTAAGQTGVRRCSAAHHLAQWLETANVPRLYQGCTLDNFTETDLTAGVVEQVQTFCATFHKATEGFWFTGPTNSGKTHLAVALVGELLRRGKRQIYFYDTAALLRRLDPKTELLSSRQRNELHRRLETAPLLVLDDFGAVPPASSELEQLDYLIDCHYRQMKPIVITSRYELEALTPRLKPRLTSRLGSMVTSITLR